MLVSTEGIIWARSIGLIRIRRTPPFSDETFDWAHPNPDESSGSSEKTTDEFR